MKRLLALLLLIPFAVDADGGFSISYRSMPSYVKDLSGEMSYDYIETGQVSFYLDDTLKSSSGAGYTMDFTIGTGTLDNRLDVYYADMLIGKRLFVIPKLLHVYGKIGPSVFAQNWHETPYVPHSDKRFINTNLGLIARVGSQMSILRGIKFFVESEFRGYGPVLRTDWNSDVQLINKFPFTEKEIDEHYRSYKGNNGVESLRNLVKESLRFGLKFNF